MFEIIAHITLFVLGFGFVFMWVRIKQVEESIKNIACKIGIDPNAVETSCKHELLKHIDSKIFDKCIEYSNALQSEESHQKYIQWIISTMRENNLSLSSESVEEFIKILEKIK